MSDEQEHARVLSDLTATTVTRVRKTLALTTQLLDEDDNDIAFVMMMVAADLITGSAYHLHLSDDRYTEEEALGLVLKSIVKTLGTKNVNAAIKATSEKTQCGG